MKFDALVQVVKGSLRRERKGALLSAFGVAIGVGALVFFVALGAGVGTVIREKIFPVDARLLDVVPPSLSLGSLLGSGKLDQAAIDRLAALEEVERVYRKMNVRVPAVTRYDGDFFGSRLRMGLELLVVGVDPGLVEGDIVHGKFEDPGPNQPIPAVASSRLFEIYNKSFAPARGLPQLSAQMVAGFTFPVEFNRSYVASPVGGAAVQSSFAQVAGVSDRAMLAGITVPLEVAIRINRQSGVDAENFTGVTLQAKDPSGVPRLIEHVRRMGLQVDDQERRLAENAGLAVSLTTSALALLSVLICLLAAVNIAHALSAQVRARAKEIGVMRAVGATRADIQRIVLSEAAVVGLLGGTVGTCVAFVAARLMDRFATTLLPDFPFKPDTFFGFPPSLLVGGVLLGVLAALGGAYLPSRRAASLDPARTLAG